MPGPSRLPCALVGAGWWAGRAHVPALLAHPDADLVAVVDADRERAAQIAQQSGAGAWTDLASAVSACPELAAVVVASPHSTHHAVVAAALDAGLHVLVEKPLALTAADAWDLVARAERAGRHLLVGYTAQYTRVAAQVRDVLHDGGIGDLAHVVLEFTSGTGAMFQAAERRADGSTPAADATSYDAEHGGGQASSQLTHAVGFLLWATGLQVEQVFAYTDRRGLGVDVVDALAFRLETGAVGVASSTGTAVAGQPSRQRVTCYGTRGWLEHDLEQSRAVVHRDASARVLELDKSEPGYPVEAPARALVDLVLHGREAAGPARPAAATAALLEAALASARDGRPHDVVRQP